MPDFQRTAVAALDMMHDSVRPGTIPMDYAVRFLLTCLDKHAPLQPMVRQLEHHNGPGHGAASWPLTVPSTASQSPVHSGACTWTATILPWAFAWPSPPRQERSSPSCKIAIRVSQRMSICSKIVGDRGAIICFYGSGTVNLADWHINPFVLLRRRFSNPLDPVSKSAKTPYHLARCGAANHLQA
jgi:hypothetical protein